jgi:hypothetical protein
VSAIRLLSAAAIAVIPETASHWSCLLPRRQPIPAEAAGGRGCVAELGPYIEIFTYCGEDIVAARPPGDFGPRGP